ncbi:MAG TPA: hypothetical protein VFR41_15230 [Acidimicrobiia bacterium]|nr:hypothetical protein [Acidimicrobiia bacterium]
MTDDGVVLYDAPVARNVLVEFGASAACGVLAAVVIGVLEGPPFTIAIGLALIVFGALFVIIRGVMPTRIELRRDEVRLHASRTTMRYDPHRVVLRPGAAAGDFVLTRPERMRPLARFSDRDDPERVGEIFAVAGVELTRALRPPEPGAA